MIFQKEDRYVWSFFFADIAWTITRRKEVLYMHGIIFIIWYITMGIIRYLWDVKNYNETFKEAYSTLSNSVRIMFTFKTYLKIALIIWIIVWPTIILRNIPYYIKALIRKIKRGF